jgi:transcriptional regulator with XRE-family HTH domain
VPEPRERRRLGDFLRARRASVAPETVGLPRVGNPRRVSGLRRDEVARLAGISPEYYTRLEQGKLPAPSQAVLDALSRALRLDVDQEEYLNELARRGARRRNGRHRPNEVSPEVMSLLDALGDVPVMVVTRQLDIVAWSRLAAVLFIDFAEIPADQRNAVRLVFLHPEMRSRFGDWPSAARNAAALLRMNTARYPNDARLAEVLEDLQQEPDFRLGWEAQGVTSGSRGPRAYVHPSAGTLSLQWQTLSSSAEEDHLIIVLTPSPGSAGCDTRRSLRELSRQSNP